MQTYIALLRGINVSGQKLIKMTALQSLFEDLKCSDVKTYIQSGNVVFRYPETSPKVIEQIIEEKLKVQFGFEVHVTVKTKEEWQTALQNNPFVNTRKEEFKWLHITFLSALPAPELIKNVMQGNYGHDEFVIKDKTIYLFCPKGYGNTKLSNNFFENKLKVNATTRNWNTINELMLMANNI